ncbi:MAG: DUF4386 domain-containing protein [Leadbetterella sp.]|nr:DUF4386 domain-containing protein [Leadbetterella sp.]
MTNHFNARITGWLFIAAAISSIIGLKLYDPVLTDNNFVLSASRHSSNIILGAICELILVATATGTGIMLFPLLKRYRETIGLAYLSFRILEVVFISIGTVSILTALSISELYTNGTIQDKNDAQNLMTTFIHLHKWTFMIGPNFMLAINTFLYSYVFLKTKTVPMALARLGIVASFLIMTAAILELLGIIEQISIWGILLALPIALYEMTLAVRLIVRGPSPA